MPNALSVSALMARRLMQDSFSPTCLQDIDEVAWGQDTEYVLRDRDLADDDSYAFML